MWHENIQPSLSFLLKRKKKLLFTIIFLYLLFDLVFFSLLLIHSPSHSNQQDINILNL